MSKPDKTAAATEPKPAATPRAPWQPQQDPRYVASRAVQRQQGLAATTADLQIQLDNERELSALRLVRINELDAEIVQLTKRVEALLTPTGTATP